MDTTTNSETTSRLSREIAALNATFVSLRQSIARAHGIIATVSDAIHGDVARADHEHARAAANGAAAILDEAASTLMSDAVVRLSAIRSMVERMETSGGYPSVVAMSDDDASDFLNGVEQIDMSLSHTDRLLDHIAEMANEEAPHDAIKGLAVAASKFVWRATDAFLLVTDVEPFRDLTMDIARQSSATKERLKAAAE